MYMAISGAAINVDHSWYSSLDSGAWVGDTDIGSTDWSGLFEFGVTVTAYIAVVVACHVSDSCVVVGIGFREVCDGRWAGCVVFSCTRADVDYYV